MGLIMEFSRSYEYSLQLGRRMAAAWSAKRDKAKTNQTPLSKNSPAWLQVVDDKYEVIEGRGQVVELIYRMCSDGMGVKLIARELMRQGISPFSGEKWTKSYVAKILISEAPIGHHAPSRIDPATREEIPMETIKHLYPPVVDEDLNAKAKVAMRQRKNKGGRVDVDRVHPFSGLIRTHDGAALWVKYRKIGRKNPKLVPYLQDQSNGNNYPLSHFECYMLSWLVRFELPEPTGKQGESEITTLQEKIAKLDYKILTLKDKINSGEEYESFLELLAGAERERKDRIQKLEQLRAITPVDQGLVTIQGLFERLSNPEDSNPHIDRTNRETNLALRAALRRLIKEIQVTIGQEHRFWPKKSLKVSVEFRDGNRAEFTHKP
jgi:hypothetical protein